MSDLPTWKAQVAAIGDDARELARNLDELGVRAVDRSREVEATVGATPSTLERDLVAVLAWAGDAVDHLLEGLDIAARGADDAASRLSADR